MSPGGTARSCQATIGLVPTGRAGKSPSSPLALTLALALALALPDTRYRHAAEFPNVLGRLPGFPVQSDITDALGRFAR